MAAVSGFPKPLSFDVAHESFRSNSSSLVLLPRRTPTGTSPHGYNPQLNQHPLFLSVSVDMDTSINSPQLSEKSYTASPAADVNTGTECHSSASCAPSLEGFSSKLRTSAEQFVNEPTDTSRGSPEAAILPSLSVLPELPPKDLKPAGQAAGQESIRHDVLDYPSAYQSEPSFAYPSQSLAGPSKVKALPAIGSAASCNVAVQVVDLVKWDSSTTDNVNTVNNSGTTTVTELDSITPTIPACGADSSRLNGQQYAIDVYLPLALDRQYAKRRGSLYEWARDSLREYYIVPEDLSLWEFKDLFGDGVKLETWLAKNLNRLKHRVVQCRVAARQKLTDAEINGCLSETQHDTFEKMTDYDQTLFIKSFKLAKAAAILSEEGLRLTEHELEEFVEASNRDRRAFINNRRREELEKEAERRRDPRDNIRANGAGVSSSNETGRDLSNVLGDQAGQSVNGGPAYNIIADVQSLSFSQREALPEISPDHSDGDRPSGEMARRSDIVSPHTARVSNPFHNRVTVQDSSIELTAQPARTTQEAGPSSSQYESLTSRSLPEDVLATEASQGADSSSALPDAGDVTHQEKTAFIPEFDSASAVGPSRQSSDSSCSHLAIRCARSTINASLFSYSSTCSHRAIHRAGSNAGSSIVSVRDSDEFSSLQRAGDIAQQARLAREPTVNVVEVTPNANLRRRSRIEFTELPVDRRRSSSFVKPAGGSKTESAAEEIRRTQSAGDKPRGMVKKISQFFGSMRDKTTRRTSITTSLNVSN